jgi:two-component system chemotaxis response regulator CheB
LSDGVIRILVVDDSALYRQLLRNVLREIPDVEVVGTAKSGQEALDLVQEMSPDLLTLDVRMPGTDGIEVLRELKRRRSRTKAVMVSSLTADGAQVTTDALLEGAFDFIHKPSSSDANANRQSLHTALLDKIQTFRASFSSKLARRPGSAALKPGEPPARPEEDFDAALAGRCEAVVIGTSTGGPVALREVLPLLPGDFAVPLLIVQHMPPQYTHSLAARLNEASPLEVVEGCDGMPLEPGWAYIAPGGRHMKVGLRAGRKVIRITDDPPENSCRPAADYLFRSAAEMFDGKVLAVIMTGMGRDGVEGCRAIKQRGGFVMTQQADSCVVYGMPKAVVEEQLTDQVVSLERLASAIARRVPRS